MIRKLIALLMTASAAIVCYAYGIYSETVDGVVWTYVWEPYVWNYTEIGDGSTYYPAVPLNTEGSVTIPQRLRSKPVTAIRGYAFAGCSKLTNVGIPNNIRRIGDYAFRGCNGLTTITIPNSVTDIGLGVFSGCCNLTTIEIRENNPYFKIESGALLSRDGSILISVPGGIDDFVIPSNVRVIKGSFAFNERLTDMEIPYEVTSVGDDAFRECTNLKNITIPATVTSIGARAFYKCTSLTSITIPDSVTSIGWYAFNGCSAITNVTFLGGAPAGLLSNSYIPDGTIYCKRKYSESFDSIIQRGGLAGFFYEGLNDYICAEDIVFTTGGTATWNGDFETSHDGYESIKNDAIGGNESSWVETTVNGSGRISFWWKASSEEYDGEVFDYAYLSVDGVPQGSLENYQLQGVAIGGKTDWTNIVFDVEGEREHTIRWTYCKDEIDEADVGDDCIWLDEFSFLPKPTISFEIGTSAIGDVPSPVQDFAGADIALPNADGFYWTDHVFDGWTDGVNSFSASSDYIIPSSNVTLVARWIAKTFVSFDIDGGEGISPELIKALPSTIVTLPTGDGFSLVDHVFDGWTDGTKKYAGGADYTMPSTNVTLSAKWIAKSFVSFDIGEGVGNVPETIKEVPNVTVTLPMADDLEWTDHVFSGWSNGIYVYAAGANYVVPSSNVTLSAYWRAKSFVSFDIGDGTGDVPETMKALPNETVTLPTGDGLSLTDHVFNGWTDGAANYAAGADYVVPETNVTLKAIWIAKRFLTFTPGGGDGEIPIMIKDVPNATVTLPGGEGLHKAKHTFIGWSDGTQTYDAGAEYVVTDSSGEFTAVWAANRLIAPTISSADVANGGTIETAIATIEITADSGTVIYYTLDGTDPTTNSRPYAAQFMADGMNVTIKAFAVKDDYFDSPVAEFAFSRKPYSAAECINAYGKAVSTGNNDAAWVRVLGDNTHDGVAALRSGTIGDDEASSVMLTVDGAGEVSFWWKVSSENPIRGRPKDYVSFCIDGEEQNWLGGEIDWTNEVYSIASSGIHTLKWTYKKNDNGTVMGDDCAWLDEVAWTPWNEVTTKQTVVPIPYGWLDSYGLLSGSDPEMAAKQLTGKRDGSGRFLTVEDDFIAGTDPTNESDVFSVSISMSNGFPVVEWRPNLNTNGVNRVYTIYGKATLDEEWTIPTNALSHFFKVEVAMPSQNKSDDTTGGNDNIGGDTPGDNGGSGEEPTGDDSGSTENSIPAGYSTNGVSCVTCTGSEWYDLGLPPTLTMKVQIKHSYSGEYEHTGIIGAMPQSNNDISDWRLFIANGPQYRWYLDYPGASGGLGVGSRISGGSTALNTIYEIEFGNFYVKDIPSNAVIISDASVVKECPSNNIRLFKINYAYPERIATGSVYYVKIYDMNASGEYELVRNLVPCKPDNAPAGLLDLIEMKFYKNNGTWISLAQ